MSIHVTVSGNPVNIRRGRMILSDLDQIKKNERDRRRRLRLEQVRQQSKEISNRLLERAKKIAREELSRLENDEKSELKQMHDKKIMEIQQKYQEDLEDIGQAHASAASQPDVDAIIEEQRKKDRAMAIKRGKEAAQRMKETKQDLEVIHQEKSHKVREEENITTAMTAKLPKPTIVPEENSENEINSSQENTSEEIVHKTLTPKRKGKRILSKKSPGKTKKFTSKEHQKMSPQPGPSGLQKCVTKSHKTPKKKADGANYIEHVIDNATDDQLPRKTVPVISTTPTKADKVARYNPEDYTQDTSDTSSISSSSSSSISDDSSYFSDATEQVQCVRTPRLTSTIDGKVRLYDHSTRQRNIYNRPLGIVERIDIGDEPNAIEAAQAMKDCRENVTAHTMIRHKLNAQRRGEDAILREKVRRDYQALMKNLDHLAQEERKLKASQIESNAENTHMRLHQRNKCQEEHRKKLNRAAKRVLNTDDTLTQCTRLPERVITLPTQKKVSTHSDVPHSTWQEPHLVEEKTETCYTHEDNEVSREEQILDMLKKVERQKRLLLQEFGASLPDDIYNVSIRPLFDDRTPAKAPSEITAKPLSPEIKVINMSTCDENVKQKRKAKKDKTSIKKIEIAVQAALDKTGPAEDKGVQVELAQQDTDVPHSSKDINTQVPHPIEPKITVVTPETDDSSNDSSNSTSSEISGMIIEIDKKEVTVTPKKRKSGVKASKRSSPRIYQKIRSTSVSSKATSPIKRFSRSQLSSRLTSPQKKTRCTDAPDTTSRRVNVHVSKSEFNEMDPSQETRVSIDASAESSQTFSGANDQNQSVSKPYQIQTRMKRWIRIKDTSDTTTSTSFASPPPIKPKSILDALTNVTPILELLDVTAPEELRRLRHDISPVSTPETPSPRTMQMPSNIPHRDKISRMLRYNSIDSQTNGSTVPSSTQNDQSTLTDLSDTHLQESTTSEYRKPSQQPSVSPKICICKNPQCKLLHTKLDDIHDYALKNCPEILQKYEDLQNLCTERIASLTDLIERVRSEQKGMDFSLISPGDETSLMQLPTSRPARNDVQAVRKLIESIEAVHAQLAQTLRESQRIIGNGDVPEDEPSCDAEIQATTSTPRSKSLDTVTTHIQKSNIVKGKAKPRIISDEKVNIQLNRFKMQKKPQAISATKERNSWPPCTLSLQEEEVIEKLSKEILEQTKSLAKASTAFVGERKGNETSMQYKVSPPKDASLKNNISLEYGKSNNIIKEKSPTKEAKQHNDFIPILTGIPKVSRAHGTVTSISARPKPPVTLLNGPYWQELESSGHELSTIVEFDTTDTANKSIKSPIKPKSIKADIAEDSQKILLKRAVDADSFKSAITVKPSVHVAPLPVQQIQDSSKKADLTTGIKHSVEILTSAQGSQEATTVCSSPEKLKNASDPAVRTKTVFNRGWIDCTLEKYNKQLQCNTVTEDPTSQLKDRLGSSINTDFNNQHKNSQHKTTSTSLNSFSGLSGISEITSSPSSEFLKYASSPEEMETALKKLGLGWAVTTLKKTREASALSSSSNSDVTPINTARRMISPTKKHHDPSGIFPDMSDVSSISIKEASKSTEQAVLLKGRTSTPKFQNSNSNSERSSTTNTSGSVQERSDSLTVPNVSLTKTKSDNKQLKSP